MGKRKNKNSRRTEQQDKIHDKAVKMRKMTDEQLVHYVEDRVSKAESEGYNRGKKSCHDLERFLDEISSIKGIGVSTIEKMREYAYSKGYIVRTH